MVGEADRANLTRVLRVLLIVDVVLFALLILFSFIDPALVPPELKKYASLFEDNSTAEKLYVAIGYALIVAILIVSIVGLWNLRRWGRILYTLFVAFLLLISLLGGAEVQSAFSFFVSQLDGMAEGAILLMVWVVMKTEFAAVGSA
jgi:hypothetical protein